MEDPQIPSATDVVVVGAGPGGYVAAIRAAQLGRDVVLVERGDPGGVCLNHGCIPSKALVETAERVHAVSETPGVTAEVDVDLSVVVDWKDGVVDELTGGVKRLCANAGVDLVAGTATFVDESTIEVDPPDLTDPAATLAFDHAVLATGSRPIEIPGFAFDDPVLSSRDALALDDVPDRLVVVGEMPFSGNGRALTTGGGDGFVRVVVDAESVVVLGGQAVCHHAAELVGELALAVTAELTASTVARTVHAHPTLGEAVTEAAANAEGEAIHTVNR